MPDHKVPLTNVSLPAQSVRFDQNHSWQKKRQANSLTSPKLIFNNHPGSKHPFSVCKGSILRYFNVGTMKASSGIERISKSVINIIIGDYINQTHLFD